MRVLILLVFAMFATSANAALQIFYQDQKLPTQAMIEHQVVTAPAATSSNLLLNNVDGDTTGAGATVTSFLAQPDVPRNIVVQPGASVGGFGGTKAGNVVVSGTDIFGKAISESIAVTDAQSGLSVGTKAFKTVTSVVFPAENSPYQATWSVGVGSKLGLKRCMAKAGDFFQAELNGVKETVAPTVAVSATSISGNTVSLNSALNGSDVDLYFVQNYRCFP